MSARALVECLFLRSILPHASRRLPNALRSHRAAPRRGLHEVRSARLLQRRAVAARAGRPELTVPRELTADCRRAWRLSNASVRGDVRGVIRRGTIYLVIFAAARRTSASLTFPVFALISPNVTSEPNSGIGLERFLSESVGALLLNFAVLVPMALVESRLFHCQSPLPLRIPRRNSCRIASIKCDASALF